MPRFATGCAQVLFHCSDELGAKMHLAAGDDAQKAEWMDVSEDNERYRNLYAGHKAYVDQAGPS